MIMLQNRISYAKSSGIFWVSRVQPHMQKENNYVFNLQVRLQ